MFKSKNVRQSLCHARFYVLPQGKSCHRFTDITDTKRRRATRTSALLQGRPFHTRNSMAPGG